ncbi:Uncharacterised protein [Collinsella intestinalis]|nr:Uncharacterised protein [Collinsella intestinalis]
MLQVAACGGGFGGDAVGEGLQQGVVAHQALEATEHIGAHGPRGFNQAVDELHVRHGSTVFVGGNIQAVDALCHEAHERSGDLVDARIAGDLAHGREFGDSGAVAFELQHEQVEVAFDHGVHLAAGAGEVGVGLLDAPLLRVDEGVRVAVEHVVGEHAQRPGTAHTGIGGLQARDAFVQRGELAGHAAAVHDACELHTGPHVRGPEAEEERVGALVGEQERSALVLIRDDSLGQALDALLAEQAMGDQCGHACLL